MTGAVPDPSEHAHDLREEGLHVFPLGRKGETAPTWVVNRFLEEPDPQAAADAAWPKTPRIQWKPYQTREPSDEEFEGWVAKFPGTNWGIATGVAIVVVDADTVEGVEFMESGAVTRTPRKVRTSKGAHFYYAVTNEFEVRNSAGTHIDIRGRGGYVVAEGSVHNSGHVYERDDMVGIPADVMSLPHLTRDDVTAIMAFNKRSKVLQDIVDEHGNLNFDATQVDPHGFDGNQPITDDWVAPGGRNVAASRLAGKYIGAGDDLQTVKAKLDEWNSQNPQPLTADELNTTIASIARTHTANHPDKPVSVQPKELESVPIYDAFELMADERPLPPYLIEGLFRQGDNVVLAGPPKSMKSFLQAEMLYSIAWGLPFLRKFPVEGEKMVAWIQAEMPWYETQRRLLAHPKAEERKNNGKPANLFITDRLKTLAFDERGVDYMIEEMIKRFNGEVPSVLAIDSLASVFAEDNENDNADMQFFLRDRIGRFREAFGEQLTIIMLHHSNKGKIADLRKDPFNSLRGASALRGWYSAGMVMFKDDVTATSAEIHFEMRGEKPIEEVNVKLEEGELISYDKVDGDEAADGLAANFAEKEFTNLVKEFAKSDRPLTTEARGGGPYAPREFANFQGKPANKKLIAQHEKAMRSLLLSGVLEVINTRDETAKTGFKKQLFLVDSDES